MLSQIKRCLKSSSFYLATAGAFCFAPEASSAVGRQQLSAGQVKDMLTRSEMNSDFKIEINDLVLKELNLFLSTSKSREFLSRSLDRLNFYSPMVSRKLGEYSLPIELAAMPIVESGYQNLPDRHQRPHGAGIWMFIKKTAQIYGLRVDSTLDERLNEELLTDAAARYLKSAKLQFGTWGHSILAFNLGNGAVKNAITELNSVDPWDIVRAGKENDRAYLAKVYAAMIIVKNPDLLE